MCDFAEYYHIYDINALSVDMQATLAAGLPENSRSIKKITGKQLTFIEELLVTILDGINILIWQRTEDGYKNRNRPQSILSQFKGKSQEKETVAFSTAEEFEQRKKQIIEGKKHA